MPDAQDVRIRALVLEVVDATPQAPSFEDIEVEVLSEPVLAEPVRRNRSRRTRRVVVVLASVTVIALGVTTLSIIRNRSGSSVSSVLTAPRSVTPTELPTAAADLVASVGSEQAQIDGARNIIVASQDVREFTFVDPQAAMREFAALYACSPAIVASAGHNLHIQFFRIVAKPGTSLDQLRNELLTQPGVTGVDSGAAIAAADLQGVNNTCHPDATPAPSAPSTPALPVADGPGPAQLATARSAVIDSYAEALTGTNPIDQRRSAMQNGAALAPTLDAANAKYGATIGSMTLTVTDLRFLDSTRAAVIYVLSTNGTAGPPQLGYAVLDDDGQWRIAENTVCSVVTLAGVRCPGW